MRLLLATLFVASAFAGAAEAATRIDDPVKFIKACYVRLSTATNARPWVQPGDIYTPRLAALFALDAKENPGVPGRADFDFYANAQDWDITDVKVTGRPVVNGAGREVVTATFVSFKKPQKVMFYFLRTASGWKLDDARSDDWTLSLMLKYDPDNP